MAFSHAGKFSFASFKTRTELPDTSGAPAARENACSASMRSGDVTSGGRTGARKLVTETEILRQGDQYKTATARGRAEPRLLRSRQTNAPFASSLGTTPAYMR